MRKYNSQQQYFLTEETVNGRYPMYILLQFYHKIIKENKAKQLYIPEIFFLHVSRSSFPFISFNIYLYTISIDNMFPVND